MGGWDYYTYQNQPASFITEIWLHMQVEAGAKKAQIPLPVVRRGGSTR